MKKAFRIINNMKNKSHLAMYGSTKIVRKYCSQCKKVAFVIDKTFTCCSSPYEDAPKEYKIMSSASGRRKYPPVIIKKELKNKQNNCCFYCEKEIGTYYISNNNVRKTQVHWDHFLPFSYAQDNPYNNWVLSCNLCNSVKGSKIFETKDLAKQYVYTKLKAKEISYL